MGGVQAYKSDAWLYHLRGTPHIRFAQEEEEEEDLFSPVAEVASEGVHKVVIIGGGPAALSAGTYAARAGLRPILLAPAFGGQLLGKGVNTRGNSWDLVWFVSGQ